MYLSLGDLWAASATSTEGLVGKLRKPFIYFIFIFFNCFESHWLEASD